MCVNECVCVCVCLRVRVSECVCVNCDIVMKDSNQHVISVVVIKHFGHYKSDSNITTS